MQYFAWYDNGSGHFDAQGWIEADTPEEAAQTAYNDGWRTTIHITVDNDPRSPVLAEYPPK